MPKKSISSVELAALVEEFQFLLGGKIDALYHPAEREIVLQVHVRGKGKQLLRIIAGKWLCLTQHKETSLKPSSFCMQLRKYLEGSILRAILQKDSERLVQLELEGKDAGYVLIIEFFSKGNIVLTDKKGVIVAVLERQQWKGREIKPGLVYRYPPPATDWKSLQEETLLSLLQKSQKRNIVTALATEGGLGGLYAEELCLRANVDKNTLPDKCSAEEGKKLYQALKTMLQLLKQTQGFVYGEEATPFILLGRTPLQVFPSYNEAIAAIPVSEKVSPYEKRIRQLEHTAAEQAEAIMHLERQIQEDTRKGELMYEHYQDVQALLQKVQELKSKVSWEEIKQGLEKNRKVRKVDLASKRVLLELG